MSVDTKDHAEELLADFRHRLRTPLNHIIGYGELLVEDSDGIDPGSAVQLKSIVANARLILAQVQVQLAPGEKQPLEEKMAGLRDEIAGPLELIIGSIGELAQRLRGEALQDLLRMNAASYDLLTSTGGSEAAGSMRPLSSRPRAIRAGNKSSLPSRVLVVDDDEANCDVLRRHLTRGGHTVSCAGSGTEALHLLHDPIFDLVLLDLMMPGMSGLEVLKHLKSDETLCNVPVVMMSAMDELHSAAQCIEMGAEDYLLKPFDPVLLRARLQSALERKRLHQVEKERTEELERTSRRLEQANEDLNRFAYAASHDLQEPLRTITTTLQLLTLRSGREAPPERQELIELAVDASLRMSQLIKDLLAYSMASGQERVPEIVDAEATLSSALDNLRQSIEDSGAIITKDSLPCIFFDRALLVQLFQNLVGNAIKYRSAHPIEIHIAATRQDRQWLFSVQDNGMGIEEEFLQTIFEPFRRLHGRRLPGTGLGLTICARIVEGFGGRIWAESKPGHGSIFRFTVPTVGEAATAAD